MWLHKDDAENYAVKKVETAPVVTPKAPTTSVDTATSSKLDTNATNRVVDTINSKQAVDTTATKIAMDSLKKIVPIDTTKLSLDTTQNVAKDTAKNVIDSATTNLSDSLKNVPIIVDTAKTATDTI